MHLPFHVRHSAFDQAIQLLRDGLVGESGFGRRVALLLTIPTYDDPVARDVRRLATGEFHVVRTVWHRSLDLPTIRPTRAPHMGRRSFPVELDVVATRPPTIVSRRVAVDPDALALLLGSVEATTVPCRVQQPEPPLDATTYELTFGEELTETRYRWTADAPDGWTPLALFAARLTRLVDHPAIAASR